MKVVLDEHSGFCFGVQFAIDLAEASLKENGKLYSLGEIVHNKEEVKRLTDKGLEKTSREEFSKLRDASVLIRAHGEPPETYKLAQEHGLTLLDASCPVVLKLQRRVQDFYAKNYQIIIFGKPDHPEVIGIIGQCHNNVIVITNSDLSDPKEIEAIDFSRKTVLISQTTKNSRKLKELSEALKSLFEEKKKSQNLESEFIAKDTLCRQVSNRDIFLTKFSNENDVVIFVAGENSSNGKALYSVCKSQNPNSYFIQSKNDLQKKWFYKSDGTKVNTVGISGSTSTPTWLIKSIAAAIKENF